MKTEPYAVYREGKRLFEFDIASNGVLVIGTAPNRKFIVPNVYELDGCCRAQHKYVMEAAAYEAAHELDQEKT